MQQPLFFVAKTMIFSLQYLLSFQNNYEKEKQRLILPGSQTLQLQPAHQEQIPGD